MNKLGKDIQVGDTIQVWWKNKQATVLRFERSVHPESRIAKFGDGFGMTIFDSDMLKIKGSERAA